MSQVLLTNCAIGPEISLFLFTFVRRDCVGVLFLSKAMQRYSFRVKIQKNMNKKLAIDGVYSAVILDLGGVLIDINIVATVEKFAKLGLKNIDKHISQSHAGGGIYTDFERGLITPAQFFDAVRAEIGHCVTDESIADAWNAMLGVFPLQRVKLIERLRSKLPVLLLSNTNVLH